MYAVSLIAHPKVPFHSLIIQYYFRTRLWSYSLKTHLGTSTWNISLYDYYSQLRPYIPLNDFCYWQLSLAHYGMVTKINQLFSKELFLILLTAEKLDLGSLCAANFPIVIFSTYHSGLSKRWSLPEWRYTKCK